MLDAVFGSGGKMKSYFVFTGTEPKVILTSYDSLDDPQLLKKLKSQGIKKFIAYEVSMESTRAKYGKYFDTLCNELHEGGGLWVLDYNCESSSRKFSFEEMTNPVFCEPKQADALDIYMVGV